MKARDINDIRNEIVANSEIGVTIGQLADQLGQHVLEQIISEGAHMLMRGTFGGYNIDAASAAIIFALEDQLPAMISGIHPSLGRDALASGYPKESKKKSSEFRGGTISEAIDYAVTLAEQLAEEYPETGIAVPPDARERLYGEKSPDPSFLLDYLLKHISIYEKTSGPFAYESHDASPEDRVRANESAVLQYLQMFNMLMNGKLV